MERRDRSLGGKVLTRRCAARKEVHVHGKHPLSLHAGQPVLMWTTILACTCPWRSDCAGAVAVRETSVEIGIGGEAPGLPAPFAAIVGFTCDSVEAFSAAFMPVADQLQGDIPNYTDIVPIIQISELREIGQA